MNLNIELLQMKCPVFMFNLTNVKIQNICHVIVAPVCVFFFFQIYSGLMRLDVMNRLKRLRNGNFQIVVFSLHALIEILK